MSRRTVLIGVGQLAVMGVIVARMHKLQVQEERRFLLLAEENRINIRLIAPERGRIYDRNGLILAGNEQNYRAVLRRVEAGDVSKVLDRIAQLIIFDDQQREDFEKEIARYNAFVPVTIVDQLSWEEFSRIAVNAPALPGVSSEVGLSRIYPLGSDCAHFLGYVGPVSDYDLSNRDDPDPLLRIPKFQIGKLGVEAKLEMSLRGKSGMRRVEVNAQGREMRELERNLPQKGDTVQLTIDAGLQNYVQARIKNLNASAVLIDIAGGDVLAIASDPSFDPNKFVRGISVPDYKALLENPYRPLFNKAIQGLYPPGSVFKIVTLLASLEAGVISEKEKITCNGFIRQNRRKFYCWKSAGHGKLNLTQAVSQSCDVYFYTLGERVGIEKISAMARKLGIGVEFKLPLSAVASGLAPTKEWKKRVKRSPWVIGDTLNAAIGQGFILASPLQLAVLVARIASGQSIVPRLINKINFTEPERGGGERLAIDERNLALLRRALFEVVNHKKGTARQSRALGGAYTIAGKTGTSQVRNISAAEHDSGVIKNEDLPFELRDHALFVGYAPYDRPRYAVAVVGEHGGGGSRFAAPIARDILLRAISGKVPPLTAYPAEQRNQIEEAQKKLLLRIIAPPKKGRTERT